MNLELNKKQKQMNPFLSQTTLYLEDDDHEPVDFNEETVKFTCHVIKFGVWRNQGLASSDLVWIWISVCLKLNLKISSFQ